MLKETLPLLAARLFALGVRPVAGERGGLAFAPADFVFEGGEAPLHLRVLAAQNCEFAGEPVEVRAFGALFHMNSIDTAGVLTLAENQMRQNKFRTFRLTRGSIIGV